MKTLLRSFVCFVCFVGLSAPVHAQKNVQKSDATATRDEITADLKFGTGKTQTFLTGSGLTLAAGSTLTLSGAVGGTPTGGTLSFANLTLTLPANVSGGTSSFQALDADLTSWAVVARASGFDTFTATPTGANLASLLTTALPASKGGTGLTALGAGVATALGNTTNATGGFVTADGTATLTGKTISGASNILTGLTSIGTNAVTSASATTPLTLSNGATLAATISALNTIYALGDSMTSAGAYQTQLLSLIGSTWAISNQGISGNTVAQMQTRFSANVSSRSNGNYVIIWGGINDIVANVDAATIEGNLQSMYTAAYNAGMKVIALKLAPFGNNVNWSSGRQAVLVAVNAWISSGAINVDYIVDPYAVLGLGNNYIAAPYDSGDGLHPNTAGYNLIGSAINAAVGTWTATASVDPRIKLGAETANTIYRVGVANLATDAQFTINDATDSLTPGMGSFYTKGGASILKTLRVSGDQYLTGNLNLGSTSSQITGGTGDMTITAGTGNSRVLNLQSTTSGGVATTFLSGGALQQTTLSGQLFLSGAVSVRSALRNSISSTDTALNNYADLELINTQATANNTNYIAGGWAAGSYDSAIVLRHTDHSSHYGAIEMWTKDVSGFVKRATFSTGTTLVGNLAVNGAGTSTIAGSLNIGGTSAVSGVRTATASLDFGSISGGASADLTISVAGAGTNDTVVLGLPAAPEAGLVFSAFVSTSGTVSVRATNITASPIDPAPAIYRVGSISF